ncbi:MAG: T9SS type A sorting domain-containing protein [bacterium]|nr:T9SS type A sorting domain-containing protein [bacterium]
MKHFLLIASCCALPLLSYSQQNAVPSGGTATGSNGSVTYSIGQIDYSNASGTDGNTNEGLQQPFEFFDPDASITEINWGVSLFPNPAEDQVELHLDNIPNEAHYFFYDLNGKLLLSGPILNNETLLDVSSYAAGNYLLEMRSPTIPTSTIQIIKH